MEQGEKSGSVDERIVRAKMESLWLNYYNEVLYSQKLITEEQRNKMKMKIRQRTYDRSK